MSGTFGYELDPGKLTETERQEIRAQILRFREDEALIHGGRYYRLTDAAEQLPYVAWQFTSEDGSKSLLNVVVRHPQANAPLIHLRLKGLDPEAIYEVTEDGSYLSGAALMHGGYSLPLLTGDYPAIQLHFVRKPATREDA